MRAKKDALRVVLLCASNPLLANVLCVIICYNALAFIGVDLFSVSLRNVCISQPREVLKR